MSQRHPSESDSGCMFAVWFAFCTAVAVIAIAIAIWLAVAVAGWLGRH